MPLLTGFGENEFRAAAALFILLQFFLQNQFARHIFAAAKSPTFTLRK
jgi:hypothetical protein